MAPKREASVPSLINGDGDDLSIVSEVTLMTHSEEKAEWVRTEFFRRAGKGWKEMEEEDRSALLSEIMAEQKSRFKHQAMANSRQSEEARERDEETDEMTEAQDEADDGDAGDLLQRFRALKESEMKHNRRACAGGHANNQRRERMGSLVQSWSSAPTARVGNSESLWRGRASSGTLMETIHSTRDLMAHDEIEDAEPEKERERAREEQRARGGNDEEEDANIRQIIELKLLVAEQQASIDTLSSRLRNAELSAGRRLARTEELEAENRSLADRLDECRARESNLRRELGRRRDNEALMRENVEMRCQLSLMRGAVFAHQEDELRGSIITASTNALTYEESVANTL